MMENVERHDDDLAEVDLTEDEIDAMMAGGSPVDVGGPPASTQRTRIELFQNSTHGYAWRLVASNGEVLAKSTSYRTKKEAVLAARALMRTAANSLLVDHTTG